MESLHEFRETTLLYNTPNLLLLFPFFAATWFVSPPVTTHVVTIQSQILKLAKQISRRAFRNYQSYPESVRTASIGIIMSESLIIIMTRTTPISPFHYYPVHQEFWSASILIIKNDFPDIFEESLFFHPRNHFLFVNHRRQPSQQSHWPPGKCGKCSFF